MNMPGRKFTAGSGYRYGFNGKEKNNEILGDGNSYDFGNRIYDSRIGRWYSLDRFENIGWSLYGFAVNNPIQYIDKGGDIQRDPKGNVIFTMIGKSALFPINYSNVFSKELTGISNVFAQVQQGYIWTNNGTPVLVYKVLSITIPETVSDGGNTSNTKTIYTTYNIKDPKAAAYMTNCFGRTMVNGQYFIPLLSRENAGAQIILDEEYKKIKGDAVSGKGIVAGDIIDIGEKNSFTKQTSFGSHLLKATGKLNTKGEILYESQFALDPEGNKIMTLKEAVKYGNTVTDADDGGRYTYKEVRVYRKSVEDKKSFSGAPIKSQEGKALEQKTSSDKDVQTNNPAPNTNNNE